MTAPATCPPRTRRRAVGLAARGFPVAASLCVGWAVYANVWRFGFPAVASDEPTYAVAGWRYIHGDDALPPAGGGTNAHNFEHPPLAKLLFGLAQLPAGHPSISADRLVAAASTLAAALIIGAWIGRTVGRWSGLLAAMLVAVLPMRVSGLDFRFGRYGMLDPVAEAFMAGSIVCGWQWFRHRGRAAWLWAVLTGVAVGLATASKENGFLGALGVVALGVMLTTRRRRDFFTRSAQALVAVAASVLTFAVCYLPLGHPVAALRFMLSFQSRHSAAGHLTDVAGRLTAHPPWWSFLWFAARGLGWWITIASLICCAAAVALRHDRLIAWCAAALVGPLLFHMFVAGVVLPYYWVMWTPAWLALTATGAHDLARAGARHLPRTFPGRAGSASAAALVVLVTLVAALAAFGVPAIADSVHLAAQPVTGPQRLPSVMKSAHLRGGVVIGGIPAWQFWNAKLPGHVSFGVPNDLSQYDTVAVGGSCEHPVPADVRALLDVNIRSGGLRLIYHDAKISVYGGSRSLLVPTQAQVAAQTAADASDGHCQVSS